MSNPKQEAGADPAKQSGEDKGSIKGPQRTGDGTPVTDTPRGSEPETRGNSGPR